MIRGHGICIDTTEVDCSDDRREEKPSPGADTGIVPPDREGKAPGSG